MQLMERDRTRVKKKTSPYKPKDSISPQKYTFCTHIQCTCVMLFVIVLCVYSLQLFSTDVFSISMHATERATVKQVQSTVTKSSQYSMTPSQEGHVLHFTLGSQGPSQSADNPLIVNIPSVAMTTALPTPPPVAGMAAMINTPVVKMTEDHPVPIPYNG